MIPLDAIDVPLINPINVAKKGLDITAAMVFLQMEHAGRVIPTIP